MGAETALPTVSMRTGMHSRNPLLHILTSITQTTHRVFGERYWLLFVWKPAGHIEGYSQSDLVLIVLKCWQIEGISHFGFLWPQGRYIHPITITHFTLCEYSLTGIVCVFCSRSCSWHEGTNIFPLTFSPSALYVIFGSLLPWTDCTSVLNG